MVRHGPSRAEATVEAILGDTSEVSLVVMVMGFAGGLALFLHGMHRVTSGLRALAGGNLQRWLARLSGNRFGGVATGLLVSATVQSSTVTMVLVIGFLSAGLLTLLQSVGVIIGANVGTTVTAQIIAFDVVRYSLPMIAVGVAAQFLGRRETIREAGTAIAGIGILFLGMGFMQETMAPLRDQQAFLDLLSADRGPLPGLLLGAGFTALIQTSAATIGIVIVMASQGLLPLETGIAISLGASLGTAISTMLATIGRPRVARRAGLIHVVFNVIGVGVMLLLIDPLAEAARWLSPSAADLTGTERLAAEAPRQIANAYTLAKVGMLVGFIGFTRQLVRLVERLVPVRPEEQGAAPRYLDDDVLNAPAIALGLVQQELARMGGKARDQVDRAVPTVLTGSRAELDELAAADDDIDDLHRAILSYLRRLDDAPLTEAEGQQLVRLMEVASFLEIVGDIVQHDLVRVGIHRLEEGVPISDETLEVVTDFHATMVALLDDAIRAFHEQDAALARSVLAAKPEVNELLSDAAEHRAARMTADAPARVAAFSRGTEAIEHLRRVYTFAKRIARSVPGAE